MSTKYPGGIISKTAPVPTGPYENGTAPGIWTLEQQAEFVKQGIWPTAGLQPNYIEDVFQTWLYTGNASTQTITNGIDLAGEGGLVWLKRRSGAEDHFLFDSGQTAVTYALRSNKADASSNRVNDVTAFNSDGFSIGAGDEVNNSGGTYVSWTFRKQPKFFDVVTYTGTGSARTVAHNLGSVPGFIAIKVLNTTNNWTCFHRSLASNGAGAWIELNNTDAAQTDPAVNYWNNTEPTDSVFTVATDSSVNGNGNTYVAYLFAHDAGGFGLTGTDNVISCGSFTTDGSGNATVSLGYEPQWVMTKRTDSTGSWWMMDTMRGMPIGSNNRYLLAEESSAEASGGQPTKPNATGFSVTGTNASATFIYIAIRRGPMKVPTDGTSVFAPVAYTGTGAIRSLTTNITSDLAIYSQRTKDVEGLTTFETRLTSPTKGLSSTSTDAEYTVSGDEVFGMLSNQIGVTDYNNRTGKTYINWSFRRAPGFFDVVCYTGTGVAGQTFAHNLGVAPELMIIKKRSSSTDSNWCVYAASEGPTKGSLLNFADEFYGIGVVWNNTAPTASVFSVGGSSTDTNMTGQTHVAYLFASCPGVSKVGSYTGTGTTQTINCGFTGGARFVLIKRTDASGDWYVWDSARGIVAGNDPYLLLNSTAAEVTNTDYVDTASTGFEISSTAPAAINASGGAFIFLAIA